MNHVVNLSHRGNGIVMARKNAVNTKKTPTLSSIWAVKVSLVEFMYLLTNKQVKANKIDKQSKWNVRGSTTWDSNWTAWRAISTAAAKQKAIIIMIQSKFLASVAALVLGSGSREGGGGGRGEGCSRSSGEGGGCCGCGGEGGAGDNNERDFDHKLKPNSKIGWKNVFRNFEILVPIF